MTPNHPSGSRSVRWNAIGLAGKQAVGLALAVVLAAMLGPAAFGVMAQAQVFISLTTLILDQGLSALLIQRAELRAGLARSVAGLNLLLACVLAAVSIFVAGPLATFFSTPELESVIVVLGLGLIIKAFGVVPRALLVRQLQFKRLALSDIVSVIFGGSVAVACALAGLSFWSLVVQVLVVDAVSAALMFLFAGAPGISLRLTRLRGELGFSVKIFLSNFVSYLSRNTDSILIGRVYGSAQLGLYGLAYRVLLTPVQMVGQVVVQVLFPHVARLEGNAIATRDAVLKSLRALAVIVFPIMAAAAVSAPEWVRLLLGPAWASAVPVLVVLAFTGARQAVTAINSPLMMAQGRANTLLILSTVTAVVQVAGIVIGLPFGILGVAWGYTVAGLVLTIPITVFIKRGSSTSYRELGASIFPPANASLCAMAAYLAVGLLPLEDWARLGVGLAGGAVLFGVVLGLFHRKFAVAAILDLKRVIGIGDK